MKSIQDFRFNKSTYDRPTQKHICGRSLYGSNCQLGPDGNGECQAQFECIPTKKQDRWYCSRSADNGGICKNGPSPTGTCSCRIQKCVPLLSKRVRRGKLIRFTALLIVSLIVIIAYLPTASHVIDPGPLSKAHQFSDEKCDNCHKDESHNPIDWLKKLQFSLTGTNQNKTCLTCHTFGSNSDLAHAAPIDFLSNNPSELKSAKIVSCVVCHREHQGRNISIKYIDDNQCQVCHRTKFSGFHSDHSEFDKWPYIKRTKIIFDHNTHINDYFSREAKQGWVNSPCERCHQPSGKVGFQNITRFNDICADCHNSDVNIKSNDDAGIPMLQLPSIDLASLKENDLSIGEWPKDLEDEELTPLMYLLLASNPNLHKLLRSLQKGDFQLSDLSEQSIKTIRSVAELAWTIKSLFYKIEFYGNDWLYDTFYLLYDKEPKNLKNLVKQFPYGIISQQRQQWFPSLLKEIKKRKFRKYQNLFTVNDFEKLTKTHRFQSYSFNKWILTNYTIAYRPNGHEDNGLMNWLNVSAYPTTPAESGKSLFKQLSYQKAPGKCSKCHSIDFENSKYTLHWAPKRESDANQNLTVFNHNAHPNTRMANKCQSCHSLLKKSNYLDSYKQFDAKQFDVNFDYLKKSECDTCHQSDKAGGNCLLCHKYHVVESQTMNSNDLQDN